MIFLRTLWISSCLLITAHAEEKVWSIMPVGDSITEGGATFANYREPLAKLFAEEKVAVKFVGTRSRPSPLGQLSHEGYGGKNSAFLAKTVPAHYQQIRADIVLIHACHNQFADKKPVAGIVRDHQTMIQAFRRANPQVIILVAGPIPSAKLPKYSYLPEARDALHEMVKRYQAAGAKVHFVDQSIGFDPKKDTIADLVHPNQFGAEKMAAKWYAALRSVMSKN
ncbi:MAG: hypothetical protein RLZZ224_1763 [Verrucomicrobiota bacterium]|jgi:lysophospholipase L1-like esterase